MGAAHSRHSRKSRLNRRLLPPAGFCLKVLASGQDNIFAPGLAHDLNPDRQAFRRRAGAHDGGGPPGAVMEAGVIAARLTGGLGLSMG